jgi:transcriptional regulator with XRE-family HTH domain
MPVTGNEDHRPVEDIQVLRWRMGARLASCRREAGLSQRQLGQALGRTRSFISKVEHGTRAMPADLWRLADQVCGAQGALVAEHTALAAAEADYRDRCRTQRHQRQIHQAGVRAQADVPAGSGGCDAWPEPNRAVVTRGLAKELMAVVTKLIRMLGRRDAIRLFGGTLAAAGVAGLDPDQYARLAHAVEGSYRVDAHVVTNLAVTLAHCKRQEDILGAPEVLDTVVAQHRLVRRLLRGGCPEGLRQSLSVVDSNMASTVGLYLVDMGQLEAAGRYFQHARKSAHDAANPAYAAYAAANTSLTARLRGDPPTALDAAAAARSLAARTNDLSLQAFAEQVAAGAYALDGQYRSCMISCDRAHHLLTSANGTSPESPAYWVNHGLIDSHYSTLLALLGKPKQALDAASTAYAHYDRSYVGGYAMCQVRLAHALVLNQEITEAARVLADAASHAHLFPRLTQELHTTRALMQPWNNTPAVKNLDTQLHAYKLY